jgi:hypothetical protein
LVWGEDVSDSELMDFHNKMVEMINSAPASISTSMVIGLLVEQAAIMALHRQDMTPRQWKALTIGIYREVEAAIFGPNGWYERAHQS